MNKYLVTLLFTLCLWPITTNDGVSVNYGYILVSALLIFLSPKVYRPSVFICFSVIFFSAIYILGFPFVIFRHGVDAGRALVSFLVFISIFVFSVIKIELEEIESFKSALILFSCLMAGNSVAEYIFFGVDASGEDMKNLVGSQRVGFVYIAGFFVLLYRNSSNYWLKFLRLVGIFLILAGLLLTFSRSSVISLIGALSLYFSVRIFHLRRLWLADIRNAISLIFLVSVGASFLYLQFPAAFSFFDERIFSRYGDYFYSIMPSGMFSDSVGALSTDIFVEEGSEGARLAIWNAIIQYVLESPVFGSGYLGSWVLEDVVTGSAHSQYMDVLLRVGFFGFVIWIFILFKVFQFLGRLHPDLFWGGVGILIYGLFHETFKESQGAFILSFLIGMYANYTRYRVRSTVSSPVFSNSYSVYRFHEPG